MTTDPQSIPPQFIGKADQLRWVGQVYMSHEQWHRPFIVTGERGTGKTAFVDALLSLYSLPWVSYRLSSTSIDNILLNFDELVRTRWSDERYDRDRVTVILDDVEDATDEELRRLTQRLQNYKPVRGVFLVSNRKIDIKEANTFTIAPLALAVATELVNRLLPYEVAPSVAEQVALATGGNPGAISLIASLAAKASPEEFRALLNGYRYDLPELANGTSIIHTVAPKIITANQAIIEMLKRDPEKLYELTPRQFEELLAELLVGMGFDVTLTPQTRDGGCDIIAYLNTGLQKLLCVVEAKKYKKDHKVEVQLIRALHGTLIHKHANSALLVTTSSFTPDTIAYAKEHEWHLGLREYADVVDWISKHRL